jgi:SAM-dependent methyltransferase
MFDKTWEKKIYIKNKQINKYPYDWVVSSVNKFCKNKRSCLDLGCGTGNNLVFLKNYGFKEIHGVEGSKTACKYAKNFLKKKNINIYNKDFFKFNYKKNFYDLVLDRGSITHNKIYHIKKILNKVYNSLQPNGIFLSVMFNNVGSFKTKKINKRHFAKTINSNIGLITNFFTKKEILSIFKKFEIIELKEEIHKVHNPKKKIYSTWNIICKKN